MRSIHLPTEPTPARQPHPLLRLGFRPFYLLAAGLAAQPADGQCAVAYA
jgi:uncharacterized protein involved in response to NO